jgi:TatD DNase family protein
VRYVAEQIADLRQTTFAEIAALSTENFYTLFKINA